MSRSGRLARRSGAVLGGVLLALAGAGAAGAKDLVGVFQDALQNDPTIRAADANRLASRESRPQALSALLPQISGTASYTQDHTSGFQDQPYQNSNTGQFYVVPLQYAEGSTERKWA